MSKTNSNKRKDELLGQPHGTAAGRLRKEILFKYVKLAGHDVCYRCGQRIESSRDLSIEHKVAWQSSGYPMKSFFDLDNIAFSHQRCNSEASDRSRFISPNTAKTHCVNGHEFNDENTHVTDASGKRECKFCRRERMRGYRREDPNYGRTPPSSSGRRTPFQGENAGSIPAGGAKSGGSNE